MNRFKAPWGKSLWVMSAIGTAACLAISFFDFLSARLFYHRIHPRISCNSSHPMKAMSDPWALNPLSSRVSLGLATPQKVWNYWKMAERTGGISKIVGCGHWKCKGNEPSQPINFTTLYDPYRFARIRWPPYNFSYTPCPFSGIWNFFTPEGVSPVTTFRLTEYLFLDINGLKKETSRRIWREERRKIKWEDSSWEWEVLS